MCLLGKHGSDGCLRVDSVGSDIAVLAAAATDERNIKTGWVVHNYILSFFILQGQIFYYYV